MERLPPRRLRRLSPLANEGGYLCSHHSFCLKQRKPPSFARRERLSAEGLGGAVPRYFL